MNLVDMQINSIPQKWLRVLSFIEADAKLRTPDNNPEVLNFCIGSEGLRSALCMLAQQPLDLRQQNLFCRDCKYYFAIFGR